MNEYSLGPGETFEDIYERPPEDYNSQSMSQHVKQSLRRLGTLTEKLEGLWPIMPKVDATGYSECPFAGDMYANKAALENEVSDEAGKLRSMLTQIDSEIERCKRNLARIGGDADKLTRPEARDKFAEASSRQESEYAAAIGERKRVSEALSRADATLAASRKKQFPGPLPKDAPSRGLSASASSYPASFSGDNLDEEINDLFSLGKM